MDLSTRKNRIIMFFITYFGGPAGIHWFIQKNWKKGLLYLFTLGLFSFGWIYDVVKTFINIFKYDPHYMEFPDIKSERVKNEIIETNKQQAFLQEKEKAKILIGYKSNDFSRILNDVQVGFKTLDPYLSRYRILLELYADMRQLDIKYGFNQLTYSLDTILELFNTELLEFIKNKILITLDKHSIDENNKDLIRDLKKIRNEIIEGKHNYPEFSDLLQEVQNQLEIELNKIASS